MEMQRSYHFLSLIHILNRFFSTLKQAMDNIDKVRLALAHKYYALAEVKPDLKDVYKRQASCSSFAA